jgi:integrase
MKGYFRKRGSKWCFTVDIGRDEATGKRKQKSLSGFKTKKEAEQACNELINQLIKGDYIEPTEKTIKDYIVEFMDSHAKQVLRQRSFDNHLVVINKHIIPELGSLKLSKVTPAQIQKFYNKKSEEGLSADYVKYMHSVLRKSFNQAVKWGFINKNVIDLAEPPRLSSKDINTWSLDEATSFLNYTRDKRFHIVYLLAIYTGMRKGEILGLRWKDVDLDKGKVSIRQTLSGTTKGLIFQEPKTKGSKRLISITSEVVAELKKHKLEQNKNKLKLGPAYEDFDLVACIETGKPLEPRNLTRHFTRMIKEADVPKLRFHDLRHTHATILLQLGEHPKVVSERLGHSKTSVTLDIYSHVVPDMQKDAADKFSNAMKSKKTL